MAGKYCKHCGTPVKESDQFCSNCRQPLQENNLQVEHKPIQPQKNMSTLKILLIVGGIIIVFFVLVIVGVFLLLGVPAKDVDNNQSSQLKDVIENDIASNDTSNIEKYSPHATTLISMDNSDVAIVGEEFVDIFKIRQDKYSDLILEVSTPDFQADIYIKKYTDDQLFAEIVLENLEISYVGEIINSEEIFSQGTLSYMNYDSGKMSVYEVIMYNDYGSHDSSLKEYYGNYSLYYRDYYIQEGELTENDQQILDEMIDGYYTYETTFNLNNGLQDQPQVTFVTSHNTESSGRYVIDNTSESSTGYLIDTSNKYAVGEHLKMRSLSHPKTRVYDGAFTLTFDNGATVLIEFEGYSDEEALDDKNGFGTVKNNPYSGSWISDDAFPLLAIIDEGTMTIPQELRYLPPYAGQDIVLNQPGFIVHDTLEGVILKMPYTMDEGIIKVNISLYAGQEFVEGNFSAICVKDANGQLYQSEEFNGPMEPIDALPDNIDLFSEMELRYQLSADNNLELAGTIILYEDGVDDIHNPDPMFGEEFDIQGVLKPY
jgi:predicted nucleic acid-binding Zn ribbon protein